MAVGHQELVEVSEQDIKMNSRLCAFANTMLCASACACVCTLERERERGREKGREGERETEVESLTAAENPSSFVLCSHTACVCVCVGLTCSFEVGSATSGSLPWAFETERSSAEGIL